MSDRIDAMDLELQELHEAVAEVQSVMAESWFHEMALCEVGEHLARISSYFDQGAAV